MIEETLKRGRPRKEPAPEGSAEQARPSVQRYKVTAYKVRTSQGRKIEGQFVELPTSEGEAFVAQGVMRLADITLRIR